MLTLLVLWNVALTCALGWLVLRQAAFKASLQAMWEHWELREHQHWKAFWGAYRKTPWEQPAVYAEDYAPQRARVAGDPDEPF